jgi:hypothetical protein
MKFVDLVAATRTDASLVRAAAVAFIGVIAIASHPSDAVRRYTLRKLTRAAAPGRRAIWSSTTRWRRRPRRRSPARRVPATPSLAISPRFAGSSRNMP